MLSHRQVCTRKFNFPFINIRFFKCFYRYKSVEPRDLWNSFDNVLFEKEYQLGILGNTITVEEFMSSWTNQAGYPVIHVDTNTHKNSMIITQVPTWLYLY